MPLIRLVLSSSGVSIPPLLGTPALLIQHPLPPLWPVWGTVRPVALALVCSEHCRSTQGSAGL